MKVTIKEEHKDLHRWWHIFWTRQWTVNSYSHLFNELEYVFEHSECYRCGYIKIITKSFIEEEKK